MSTSPLENLYKDVLAHADASKAKHAQRFFKTGKGDYAENDRFLGLTVPQSRIILKKYLNLSLDDLTELIHSPRHEHRLIALLIAVTQYKKTSNPTRHKELLDRYITNTAYINNRDLVDSSAEHIVGAYLYNEEILFSFAQSSLLRERRIAIVATFYNIKKGDPSLTMQIAELLFHDSHDLIHKASGWMLREVGKRCDEKFLTDFLDTHAAHMPRTMLRYSIERLATERRKYYMNI